MNTFHYCSVIHQSGLQRNTFSKLSYIFFFNTSKCTANYVISFEINDGFIGQKTLKLWRQESLPFGPGWAAELPRISSWTSRGLGQKFVTRFWKNWGFHNLLSRFSDLLAPMCIRQVAGSLMQFVSPPNSPTRPVPRPHMASAASAASLHCSFPSFWKIT